MKVCQYLLLLTCWSCGLVTLSTGQLLQSLLNSYSSVLEQTVTESLGALDEPMSSLFRDIPGMEHLSPIRISQCYVAELKGHKLNLFDPLTSFKTIVTLYYKAFTGKKVTADSVKNLLDSSREIVTICLSPQRPKHSTAKYGFTFYSDKSREEFVKMNGLLMKPFNLTKSRSKRLSGNDFRCLAQTINPPESFDWRSRNVVTPVRAQDTCSSCWTFAALATLESALLIHQKVSISPERLDLSEQQLVQCARPGQGCQGGTSYMAYSYLVSHGVGHEHEMPYTGEDGYCPAGRFPNRNLIFIRNFCVRSAVGYTPVVLREQLTDADILFSLLQFGPLFMAINMEGLSRNYRAGVLDSAGCRTKVDHAVVLVGYTANSWIFKNSWGEDWGNMGYFEVVRGRNWCGINTEIAWPLL